MSRLFAIVSCVIFFSAAQAQTCVGIFNFKLFDPKTKKPVKEKLGKSVTYVFTMDENEFYDDIQTIIPLDSVKRSKQGYTIRSNERGYNFLHSDDPSWVSVPALCGEYLIHMDFYGKKDTMSLSFYNVPAHQSFQIDTVMFQGGAYYFDLKASTRLSEFPFLDDKGYFLVPPSEILPFFKKED